MGTELDILQNMIRRLAIPAVAIIFLSALTTGNATAAKKDSAELLSKLQDVVSFVHGQKALDNDILSAGKHYNLEALAKKSDLKYRAIIRAFLESYESGMLPRGALSSPSYSSLLAETQLTFQLLYNAPSLWDLICIIIWNYFHVNQSVLSYALEVALLHRSDTANIEIPPLHMVAPGYFFNSDFMKQVYDFQIGLNNMGKSNETITFVAEAKYTNWYTIDTTDCEWNLTYFMEDIGLSNWFFLYNLRTPRWLSGKEYPLPDSSRRGEIWAYIMTWILARYNMERLSNNLDEVLNLSWDKPIPIGYSPSMNNRNGMQFPRRKEHSTVPDDQNRFVHKLKDIEWRLAAVADSGYMMTTDGKYESVKDGRTGIEKFGNLIQGNGDSLNLAYYSSYDETAKNVLGFSPLPQTAHQVLPSALQHFATSFRDPAFYRLCKKIGDLVRKYKMGLPVYTQDQLGCSGVEINSVGIAETNVTTYFEWFDTVISDFRFDHDERSAVIKARQYRLNHRPVTFNLKITSDRDVDDAIIRIFIGPKCNVWGKDLSEHYKYFYEVHYFLQNLKKGENTFQETMNSTSSGTIYDFPNNLIFPKGRVGGLSVQFFFHVSKFNGSQHRGQQTNLLIRDDKPLGYPLDRPISDLSMPNMALLDSTIYREE